MSQRTEASIPLRLPEAERGRRPFKFLGVAIPLSLLIAVAALFVFAWIAEEVLEDHTRRFDTAVRGWVHQFSSPWLTRAAKAASFIGADILVAALIACLLVFAFLRWRRAALWLTITMAGALVLNLSLKYAFHRQRPTPFFVPLPHTYSFPSGHALFSVCFYGVLAGLLADRIQSLTVRICIWAVAALLIATIGLSRIYLGVHYPTDVLGGYLAAAVWVSSMIAFDRLRTRAVQK
jgi:undecaprenyl-diphosphatase